MATGETKKTVYCEPCLFNNSTVPAVTWCLSCEEGLCQSCTDSHRGSKATRKHKTIPVEKCNQMAKLGQFISQQCREHHKEFDLYCSAHDEPICHLCVSKNHRTCKEIKSLADAAKNVVSSSSFVILQEEIEHLKENIALLSQNRQDNKNRIEYEKLSLPSKIKEMRQKINDSLDKLEDDLLKKASSLLEEGGERIISVLIDLDQRLANLLALQTDIAELKDMATDVQLFLGIRGIRKHVDSEITSMEKILTDHKADELTVSLDFNPMIEISKLKSLGTITLSTSPCKMKIMDQKVKGAQLYVQPVDKTIENITLFEVAQITGLQQLQPVFSNMNNGCKICYNGDLIFACDSENQLQIFHSNGHLLKKIPVSGTPSDITLISKDVIAVTYGNDQRIDIADITDYRYNVKKTIKTDSTCWGIDCHDNKLAVRWSYDGIKLYNLEGEIMWKIEEGKLRSGEYNFYCIAMHGDSIYFADPNDRSVNCVDEHGNQIWKYNSENIDHSGITTDQYGNVFVGTPNQLTVISKDGKRDKKLPVHGLPVSLDFDKSKNQLLVRYYDKRATLYDVKYAT